MMQVTPVMETLAPLIDHTQSAPVPVMVTVFGEAVLPNIFTGVLIAAPLTSHPA
jgi:hypothetical protein